jgi:stage II sporulation protein D
MERKRLLFLIPLLLAMLLLGSCLPQRRPVADVPAIPEAIARGQRQEPTLKVWIAEEEKVQEMQFEEYIAGVVAAEMDTAWPEEALAAQAILARTFTLEKIAQNGGVPQRGAHASTDIEEFQAYDASRINDKVRQAVERTRGEVAHRQGKFVKAWFHANSGGRTATALEGLEYDKEPTPYVVSVEDAISVEAAPADQVSWKESFSLTEVRQALKKIGQDPGQIRSVEVVDRGESGRATRLRIGNATVSAPSFRLAIGSTRMKSTLLESFKVEGNRLIIAGKGYGHGVGMSQWGAKGRAERGEKAEDIVKAYFQNVSIDKIWD